jgi:uncharacterized peroxidase-related enzyme
MPFLPSLGDEDKVPHALAKFNPGTGRPLVDFHEILLRGESPFTVAERELMAAFVSGVNACQYCSGSHTAVSKLFGVPEPLIINLVEDETTADIDDKMRPVFAYIRKLTLTPSRMTQADADAVYAAGWDERALYDAVQVCGLFNYMNRFVEGLGLSVIPEQFDMEGGMIKQGYAGILEHFDIK